MNQKLGNARRRWSETNVNCFHPIHGRKAIDFGRVRTGLLRQLLLSNSTLLLLGTCSHLLETTFQHLLAMARQAQTYAAVVETAREVAVTPHVDNDIQIAVIENST